MVSRMWEGVVKVTDVVMEDLLQAAASDSKGKAMALLHESETSPIQEMIIAWAPGTVVDRHATTQDSESILCLKGSLSVVVFLADGSCSARYHMMPPGQGGVSSIRLSAKTWIAYKAGPQGAVILEHAIGPFSSSNTVHWPLNPKDFSLLDPTEVDPKLEGDE